MLCLKSCVVGALFMILVAWIAQYFYTAEYPEPTNHTRALMAVCTRFHGPGYLYEDGSDVYWVRYSNKERIHIRMGKP